MTQRPRLLIATLTAILAAGLLLYSQTHAFAWDEGWHLLAAQSILRGKRVYLDFCYPQTPLNAYWNAGWMRLFGDTWRTAHAVASVMTALGVLLLGDYLLRRFPIERWRTAAAVIGVVAVGLNAMVFEFGTVGQAYGLCFFLIVAAYRAAVACVKRDGLLLPAAAGFLSCAAANATLLTAPVAPLLLLWILIYNQFGHRWSKLGGFLAGGTVSFLPLAWFFARSPRLTLFNVFEYNFYYRRLSWEGATEHDIDVMLSWIDSSQALILLLLAVGGLLFVWKRSQWKREQRAEFYLCAWLAAALAFHISRGHPNFERYYLFTVPFLAVLACAGLYALGSAILDQRQCGADPVVAAGPPRPAAGAQYNAERDRPGADRPAWPAAIFCLLVAIGLAKSLYQTRDYYVWAEAEDIAKKMNEVTPPGGMMFADELTYFISRRPPPPGMELADSHKFNLAPGSMAQYHLISKQELERRLKAGEFDSVETWEEDDKIKELGLPVTYENKAIVHEANIFWGKKR